MVHLLDWLRRCPSGPSRSRSPEVSAPAAAPLIPAPRLPSPQLAGLPSPQLAGSIPANLHMVSDPMAVPVRQRAVSAICEDRAASFDEVFPASQSFTDGTAMSPSDSGVFLEMDKHRRYSVQDMEFYKAECEKAIGKAQDQYKCIICFTGDRAIMFSPCHHVITCSKCANTLPFYETITGHSMRKCPVCMKYVRKMTKIFLS
ncbi:uncharacterized protein LOC129581911 [Paramacrobiotus metropolitanus]|uniref:uncharacterized protein LOC129581911 n=1 Tax=Paramacrobiotus metropolitanus TaxID=2943436 RepID=UPI0024461F2E|nr:uncharacterized protein LOC129581911 [Paramacrobiotus metropolitanus]XP_055329180.1 uncharacterized protein LOC129581911 [Paramacrobiotus metropolitanus]XP_055329181.1 uncharacterized protein LOC129581911 [Paramacrobiotus metropolitanus]XP_055329182.1 uncharacterized protein LOC129581911 [Paramacrobiotus metropolitanus]XP_055329183.1 uncharacterized protein LOC129581911 [Paramacrobiotus metropolitanus]XP_055329184.1 uncharacterized protein LOC129581911 [Paramacrobiotus metropolitanus]